MTFFSEWFGLFFFHLRKVFLKVIKTLTCLIKFNHEHFPTDLAADLLLKKVSLHIKLKFTWHRGNLLLMSDFYFWETITFKCCFVNLCLLYGRRYNWLHLKEKQQSCHPPPPLPLCPSRPFTFTCTASRAHRHARRWVCWHIVRFRVQPLVKCDTQVKFGAVNVFW